MICVRNMWQKGASDVDEVCPYMVYVYGPRKYGVNGAEL